MNPEQIDKPEPTVVTAHQQVDSREAQSDVTLSELLGTSINRPHTAPLQLLLHEIDEHGNTNGSGARVADAIRAKALKIKLSADKIDIQDAPTYVPRRTEGDDKTRQIEAITEYSHKASDRLAEAFVKQRDSGGPIVSVGGNHNRAFELTAFFEECALRGKEPVIVWIDAHPDAQTPGTTESGNTHGMVNPLTWELTLRGGSEQLIELLKNAPMLKPENLIYLGLNAVDEKELENLIEAKIPPENIIPLDDVILRNGMSRWTECVDRINARLGNDAFWWCEVDVDVLERKSITNDEKAADMDSNYGLYSRELIAAIKHLSKLNSFAGLGISEISKDAGEGMIDLASDLILITAGIKNRPYAEHLDHNQIGRSDELVGYSDLVRTSEVAIPPQSDNPHIYWRYGGKVAATAALFAASAIAYFNRPSTSESPPDKDATKSTSVQSKEDLIGFEWSGMRGPSRFKPLPFTGDTMGSVESLLTLATEYVSATEGSYTSYPSSFLQDSLLSCLFVAELNGGDTEQWKALKNFLVEEKKHEGRKLYFELSAKYEEYKQEIDRPSIVRYLALWGA